MGLRLGNRVGDNLLEVVGSQRVVAVVRHQVVEIVEEDVVYEIVLRLSSLLSRPDAAVVHAALAPIATRKVIL